MKINLQNNTHNITSTTHPNLPFYLRETDRICNFLANCCDYARKQYKAPISFLPEVYETSSKTGSRIRILYLLTGPMHDASRHRALSCVALRYVAVWTRLYRPTHGIHHMTDPSTTLRLRLWALRQFALFYRRREERQCCACFAYSMLPVCILAVLFMNMI